MAKELDPNKKGQHVCGACQEVFDTEKEYNKHVCEKTGLAANTIEHHDALTDGMHSRASEAALARGEARKDEDAK